MSEANVATTSEGNNTTTDVTTYQLPESKPKGAESMQPDNVQDKTYTQSEIDKMLPNKEEFEAFTRWKADQKTAEQKIAESLEAEKKRADSALQELNRYKQLDSIRKLNVDESYLGYINYEVSELAKSKNISFDDALAKFIKDNAEKYAKQNTRIVSSDIGSKGNINAPESQINFKFNGVRPQK